MATKKRTPRIEDVDNIRTDMFKICDNNVKRIEEKKLQRMYDKWMVGVFVSMVFMIILLVFKTGGLL